MLFFEKKGEITGEKREGDSESRCLAKMRRIRGKGERKDSKPILGRAMQIPNEFALHNIKENPFLLIKRRGWIES